MLLSVILCSFVAVVTAASTSQQRIVGGSLATIDQYPEIVALLVRWSATWYMQDCGGIILNNRSVLTAAHCIHRDTPPDWRARAGSSFASSGGQVYDFSQFIIHPGFHRPTFENDIAVLRTSSAIAFSSVVRPGNFAGSGYPLADNDVVWAAGWGKTSFVGSSSEQLRHVQIYIINQEICRQRYGARDLLVDDNMVCAGVLDVGGRDQCGGDSGGPLFHQGAVVGITSWGRQCALAHYPGVNVRVSRYSHWIRDNA